MSARSRRRSGTLMLLAGLLIASGVVRLGLGASHAIARETPPAATLVTGAGCTPSPDIAEALAALQRREAELDRVARDQATRRRSLDLAQQELTEQIAALQAAEARLRETVALVDNAAERDIDRLVAVYETMKPKQAAELFQQMAPDFAAGFLARMRPEAAAQVMAGLDPAFAYSVSVVLAGRNARAPRQ